MDYNGLMPGIRTGMLTKISKKTNNWRPPNALLWYHGPYTRNGKWMDCIGDIDGKFQGGASANINGVACSGTKYITSDSTAINNLINGLEEISFSCWIKATGTFYGITKQNYYNLNNWAAFSYNSSQDRLACSVNQTFYGFGTKRIHDGNWHHIACVFKKNAQLLITVDTISSGAFNVATFNNMISVNSLDMIIGLYSNYIDDVIICNKALTTTQILEIYNNSPGTHK